MVGYESIFSESTSLKLSKPNPSAVDGEVNPTASAKLGHTQVSPESSYIEEVRAQFHYVLPSLHGRSPDLQRRTASFTSPRSPKGQYHSGLPLSHYALRYYSLLSPDPINH